MPLRPLQGREIIRKPERAGFVLRRQKGSLARHIHPDGRKVTVPIHPGDISVPVLRSILHQARLSREQWEAL